MRATTALLIIAPLFLAGCASSHQGMKMRAQAPTIDEAFRKISLAVTVDGYQVQRVEPSRYILETGWRDLRDREKSNYDVTVPPGTIQSKIQVRLEARGRLYDVFLTPMLKYADGREQKEVVADVRHPLWEKWSKALGSLLEREAREED